MANELTSIIYPPIQGELISSTCKNLIFFRLHFCHRLKDQLPMP